MNSNFTKLVALVGFIAISVLCYLNRYEKIEKDLLERSQEALKQKNLPVAIVSMSGRDATLRGTLDSREAVESAEEMVQNVRGIRKVTNNLTAAVSLDESPAEKVTQRPASRLEKQIAGLFEANTVLFEKNTSRLTAECITLLDTLSLVLRRNNGYALEIRGHTDSSGDELYNRQLSQLRADAVRDYLVQKGISANRLTCIGLGESEPKTDDSTELKRQENRRVEFRIKEEQNR